MSNLLIHEFITYYDVNKYISAINNVPDYVLRIECFSECLEINIKKGNRKEITNWLYEVFKDSYDEPSESIIFLKNKNSKTHKIKYKIVIEEENTFSYGDVDHIYPLFPDIFKMTESSTFLKSKVEIPKDFINVYLSTAKNSNNYTLNESKKECTLSALMLRHDSFINKRVASKRILVIDADFYSNQTSNWFILEEAFKKSNISYLSFLEMVHDYATAKKSTINEIMEYYASNMLKCLVPTTFAENCNHEVFILPSYLNIQDLWNRNLKSEHIVKNLENNFLITDFIIKLAKKLRVNHVFIDLGNVLNDDSLPFIFDERLTRNLIGNHTQESFYIINFLVEKFKLIKANTSNIKVYLNSDSITSSEHSEILNRYLEMKDTNITCFKFDL